MANICDNTIVFKGRPEVLKKLYNAIIQSANENLTFTETAELLGIVLPEETYVRGEFVNYEDYDGGEIMKVYADTAWSPTYEYWDNLCEALGISYAALSEESGMEIYNIHNDPDKKFFPEKYVLDIWDDNEAELKTDYCYFETDEEVVSYLNKNCSESSKKDTLLQWINYLNEAKWGSIHKFVEV
jgi:hypothetical protein